MSSLTANPASQATSAHRAQIVAEAVVSAYIHEITPTVRPRGRARARHSCTEDRIRRRPADPGLLRWRFGSPVPRDAESAAVGNPGFWSSAARSERSRWH